MEIILLQPSVSTSSIFEAILFYEYIWNYYNYLNWLFHYYEILFY